MSALRRLHPNNSLSLTLRHLRKQSTYQPPTPPRTQQSNPHRDFYKTFGRPIAKSLLIAVFTYQVLYYGWIKLESMEVKERKESEMQLLEGELKGLTRKST